MQAGRTQIWFAVHVASPHAPVVVPVPVDPVVPALAPPDPVAPVVLVAPVLLVASAVVASMTLSEHAARAAVSARLPSNHLVLIAMPQSITERLSAAVSRHLPTLP